MSSLAMVPFIPEDVAGVTALNDAHYSENDLSFREYFNWKFFQSPHGPARIILCKDRDASDRIVGKTVGIPREIKIGEQIMMADVMTDILVHPDYRGKGIAPLLAKALYEECTSAGYVFSYAVANPQSLYFHSKKLNTRIAGEVPLMIKLIDLRGLIKRFGWMPFADRLLSLSQWFFERIRPAPKERKPTNTRWEIRELTRFDDSFNRFWTAVENKRPVIGKRGADYLQWRFGDVPQRTYRKWVAREKEHGNIQGYIVTRVMEVNAVRCGMIADFIIQNTSEGMAAGMALIAEAEAYFRDEKTAISGCLMLPGTTEFELLRTCGYVGCPRRFQPQSFPIIIEPQACDPALASYFGTLANWFFTMGDFDVV